MTTPQPTPSDAFVLGIIEGREQERAAIIYMLIHYPTRTTSDATLLARITADIEDGQHEREDSR